MTLLRKGECFKPRQTTLHLLWIAAMTQRWWRRINRRLWRVRVCCQHQVLTAVSSPTAWLLSPGEMSIKTKILLSGYSQRSDTHEKINMTLGDFRIKFSELEFGKTLQSGPGIKISQGRWHGDVIIHCSGVYRLLIGQYI